MVSKAAIGFVAAALFGVMLASAGCRTDIQSGIDSANDMLYQKQYVEAARLYRKLLKRLPQERDMDEVEYQQRLKILDALGKVNALYLNDYSQAIADYGRLVRLYPKTDEACAARAMVADIYQHKLGDIGAAIDEYQKLVNEFPNRNETRWAQLQIAQGYFQQKNYDQARTEAEALINRWPDTKQAAQARFQIANSYYVQGRYTEAIATYERLLEEKPDASLSSLVLFELGNCFQELGEPERALAYFYACLTDHPNPLLVQRKIKRVRRRLHSSKPISGIYQALYAKRQTGGGATVSTNGATGTSGAAPKTPAPQKAATTNSGAATPPPAPKKSDAGSATTSAPPPAAKKPPPPKETPPAPTKPPPAKKPPATDGADTP